MHYLTLEETESTNTWVAQHAADIADMTMVVAMRQTAGRGQRGNTWESEPGKNLTFTLLKRHEGLAANRQFAISEATALAVVAMLADFNIEASVKWPNDIYVADKKICGILIEHSVMGRDVTHSIIGAGININQTIFVSDAPNPVSMTNILGKTLDIDIVRESLSRHFEANLAKVYNEAGRHQLHSEFKSRLWRGNCEAEYIDTASNEQFRARIVDVEPMGFLLLQAIGKSSPRRYAFKEVQFRL